MVTDLQNLCPHRTQFGKTALMGQRIGFSSHEIYVCQHCQKEWDETDIPENLKPDYIGGAEYKINLNRIETFFYTRKSGIINKLVKWYLKKFRKI